jgi:hypothetical protein
MRLTDRRESCLPFFSTLFCRKNRGTDGGGYAQNSTFQPWREKIICITKKNGIQFVNVVKFGVFWLQIKSRKHLKMDSSLT